MAEVQRWRLTGDWFDLCRCRVPCGCTFAQAPDEDECDGILAWQIREGNYGDVSLDGLNVVMVGSFMGNLWTGEAHDSLGFFIDERADDCQREALQAIFGGEAGGWPAGFAGLSTRCAESSSRRSRSRSPTTSPTGASRFPGRQRAAPRR